MPSKPKPRRRPRMKDAVRVRCRLICSNCETVIEVSDVERPKHVMLEKCLSDPDNNWPTQSEGDVSFVSITHHPDRCICC